MKLLSRIRSKIVAFLAFVYFSFPLLAQDGEGIDIDVDLGVEESAWYENPLYLIIGALVLVIIIFAVARGSKK